MLQFRASQLKDPRERELKPMKLMRKMLLDVVPLNLLCPILILEE